MTRPVDLAGMQRPFRVQLMTPEGEWVSRQRWSQFRDAEEAARLGRLKLQERPRHNRSASVVVVDALGRVALELPVGDVS